MHLPISPLGVVAATFFFALPALVSAAPTPTPTSTAASSPSYLTNPSSAPSPTQTGIAAKCSRWVKAGSGDNCWSLGTNANISSPDLYAWNQVLGPNGSQCDLQVWPGYWYCVGVSSTTSSSVVASTSSKPASSSSAMPMPSSSSSSSKPPSVTPTPSSSSKPPSSTLSSSSKPPSSTLGSSSKPPSTSSAPPSSTFKSSSSSTSSAALSGATAAGTNANCTAWVQARGDDNCYDFAINNGIYPYQLHDWNPVLGPCGKPCTRPMAPGNYYCIMIVNGTGIPKSTSSSTTVLTATTRPATSSSTAASTAAAALWTGVPTAGQTIKNWAYMGCGAEPNGAATGLSGSYFNFGSNATVENCIAYCGARNFLYAGLETGMTCVCGNKFVNSMTVGTASGPKPADCEAPCSGNTGERCGTAVKSTTPGQSVPGRMSLFNNTAWTPTTITYQVGEWVYFGCYGSGDQGQVVGEVHKLNTVNMTIEFCSAYCDGLGRMYSAISSADCACSNQFNGDPQAGRKPDSYCTASRCKGDATEFCGSPVYQIVYTMTGPHKRSAAAVAKAKRGAESLMLGWGGQDWEEVKRDVQDDDRKDDQPKPLLRGRAVVLDNGREVWEAPEGW